MELNNNYVCGQEVKYLSEKDVNIILEKYFDNGTNFSLKSFNLHNASDKMLGFLADYWKLKVNVMLGNQQRRVLTFFIKAVSRSNAAKAAMVKDLNLFDKEVFFYSVIKKNIELTGVKPWSPKLAALLHDAVVFEDLSAKNYTMRDKFLRFDQHHTEQALQAIARFHASSIVFEERKSQILKRQYRIEDEFKQLLDSSGYKETDTWFVQCMDGALEAVKAFSKHAKDDTMNLVESKWRGVWANALQERWEGNVRKVICHRDLWNNNIMFHYNDDGKVDDCLMVDYQAVMCQPPACDVMLLLYCNLDPKYREEIMTYFLHYYYNQLKDILGHYEVDLESVISIKEFLCSAEEQRNWGLILCACLIPQFWVSDELTTKIFSDSAQFDEILSKNKGVFIKEMMMKNNDYKEKVLEIFDEIVERYCLKNITHGHLFYLGSCK